MLCRGIGPLRGGRKHGELLRIDPDNGRPGVVGKLVPVLPLLLDGLPLCENPLSFKCHSRKKWALEIGAVRVGHSSLAWRGVGSHLWPFDVSWFGECMQVTIEFVNGQDEIADAGENRYRLESERTQRKVRFVSMNTNTTRDPHIPRTWSTITRLPSRSPWPTHTKIETVWTRTTLIVARAIRRDAGVVRRYRSECVSSEPRFLFIQIMREGGGAHKT